jgi:hypothetical protein
VGYAAVIEERIHWKLGNGDPYNGGRFGFDVRVLVDDETVVATASCRPEGAITIDVVEYDALEAAFRDTWETRAVGGQAFVDDVLADRAALRDAAVAKLVAGDPLTAAEAAAIAGGA